MSSKTRLAAVAAAILTMVGFAPVHAAGLPVAKKVLALKSKDLDFSVDYPQTGNARIDAVFLDYAKRSLATFKTDAADRQPGDPAYTLETTYSVERNDGKVFAVLFSVYTDEGGAHPNGNYDTFNFLLPDGAQVLLPEIVDGARGIKRISDIVTADLIKRIGTGADAASDPDTIKMGSSAYADNFKDFILEPTRVHIYFPAYQVAAYVAGPQEASVPLASLKDVMRSDWRAPAPSFDCKAARSAIEHAICSDVALARLDRQVSEAYVHKLRDADSQQTTATVKDAQRAFVAARDKACASASQLVVCLTKSYAARLAELNKV